MAEGVNGSLGWMEAWAGSTKVAVAVAGGGWQ